MRIKSNSYAVGRRQQLPESAVVHKVYRGPGVTNVRPSAFPTPLTYSVWAYKLTDGKWVKDASYSWTTQDRNSPWTTLRKSAPARLDRDDNTPRPCRRRQRYVDGGTVHGAKSYTNRYTPQPRPRVQL